MKKQTEHRFTMRCSDELADKLRTEAERLSLSVTALLRIIAIQYFNLHLPLNGK